MEKVNAMKKIALFMMIVGLAVAMVACQGAVGKPGDKGDKGDKGDSGDSGTSGSDGISAFAVNANAVEPILVNDGELGTGAAIIGTLPGPFSASKYFLGGYPMIKYKLAEAASGAIADTSVFEVDVAADGTVTIKARKENATPLENGNGILEHYGTGTAFEISATDNSGDTMITVGLSVKRNRAPRLTATTLFASLTVGTQDVFVDPDTTSDVCTKRNTECVTVNPENATSPGTLITTHFADEDVTELVFAATSPKADVASAVMDSGKLVVTGLKGKANDDGTLASETVTIEVTATDKGDLPSSPAKGLSVTVNPAPMLHPDRNLASELTRERDSSGNVNVLGGLGTFFDDDDDLEVTVSIVSDPDSVVTGPAASPFDDSGQTGLTFAAQNAGVVTIKLRATETRGMPDLGQYVEHTIAVTVK